MLRNEIIPIGANTKKFRLIGTNYSNRDKILLIFYQNIPLNLCIFNEPCMYVDIEPSLKYVPRVQKQLSVMVWAGISAVGRTPLIFVRAGVKINSTTYCELILEPVVKNLSQNMFNGGSFIFQQDGAPAHTSNASQTWLRKNIPQFIKKDEWPPYSPDLNPMDYSVWSILESRVCTKSHKSIDSLKRKLKEEWEKIPQEVLRAIVEALPGRI